MSPSATQTGQGGGSLTMLIKHQGGGAQPRAQPTRDWEDSNTCTYGLPEYTTSREHVLHHTGEREEGEKKAEFLLFLCTTSFSDYLKILLKLLWFVLAI